MLYIIGIGLHDEKDISLKGIEAAKKCKKVYMELYTCPLKIDIKVFEKIIGKKVKVLERREVEEEDSIIDSAAKTDTAFIAGGDALSATTHIDLAMQCRKKGIGVKIIHGSSIFSAVAECGLQLYKFGRTVSLPYPKENYFPDSPYENIALNLKAGMHTLLLLDIGMKANEAMDVLLALEKRLKGRILTENTKIVVAAHLGAPLGATIKYGKIKDLKEMDFGELPHTIVIPGKLHFAEEEYLLGLL